MALKGILPRHRPQLSAASHRMADPCRACSRMRSQLDP